MIQPERNLFDAGICIAPLVGQAAIGIAKSAVIDPVSDLINHEITEQIDRISVVLDLVNACLDVVLSSPKALANSTLATLLFEESLYRSAISIICAATVDSTHNKENKKLSSPTCVAAGL
ncbi:hypothetical protein [Yoonia sediminilitoris]|uniref:hypothetical protein n=1 Tax=Yoonia sediminilitoris TaxID=1286148 RepID=UPI000D340589|nr:hypothetical protein [Yoonia sediminilitoris]